MPNWYCIGTSSGKERVAEDRLKSFKIQTFLPFTEQSYLDGFENERTRRRALFPGYLFAHCERGDYSLAASGWRKEILRLIGFGSEPQIVPEAIIADIRQRVDLQTGLVVLDDGLRLGEQVEIVAGAYAGQVGLFCRDEQKRVWVLLELLSRPVPIPLSRVQIRPVPSRLPA